MQSWMHMAGWECAVTYDFQDAMRMDAYADGSTLLPTGWKGYGACVFDRRVNETAGSFVCPDSLKVVRSRPSINGHTRFLLPDPCAC